MSLRLVTPDTHAEMLGETDAAAPAAGVVIGVFCGAMFWIGLGLGWAFWA